MREDEKELGCCGYDELAYKPPTTRPFSIKMPARRLRGTTDIQTPVRQMEIEKPAVGNMPRTAVAREVFSMGAWLPPASLR